MCNTVHSELQRLVVVCCISESKRLSAHCVSLFLSGLFSFVFGFLGMIVYDGRRVRQSGVFQGYNAITCTVVVLQVWSLVFSSLYVSYSLLLTYLYVALV